MSSKYLCKHCGYKTNRKWSFEDHCSRPSACEKRIKRQREKSTEKNVNPIEKNVNPTEKNVNLFEKNVNPTEKNVNPNNKNVNECKYCNQNFSTKSYLMKHEKKCKGVHSLQCPTCKKTFTTREGKYKHMKNVKCELVLTEEQQRIKELEEELEEEREKSKEKDKQLEEARARPTTVYNTTNNTWNNYFNSDIKYNDYDKLSTEHITNEQIHDMYIENRRYFPDVSEAVSRHLFRIEENRCIYVPEGQKASYGIVYKDGKYIRKPITHIFATVCDTGARHIFESGAIPEKDYRDDNSVNFWNDMSRAIGLQKTDYDDLSQFDKDLITRQKYVGLDVQDEKIIKELTNYS
jgi:hypothetical protein